MQGVRLVERVEKLHRVPLRINDGERVSAPCASTQRHPSIRVARPSAEKS